MLVCLIFVPADRSAGDSLVVPGVETEGCSYLSRRANGSVPEAIVCTDFLCVLLAFLLLRFDMSLQSDFTFRSGELLF